MLISMKQGKGDTHNITYLDANGVAFTPDAGDVITCVIKTIGGATVFSVDSTANTPNGSSFTKGNPCVLRLDDADMVFTPGCYSILFELTDQSDANEVKSAARGVFYLEDT